MIKQLILAQTQHSLKLCLSRKELSATLLETLLKIKQQKLIELQILLSQEVYRTSDQKKLFRLAELGAEIFDSSEIQRHHSFAIIDHQRVLTAGGQVPEEADYYCTVFARLLCQSLPLAEEVHRVRLILNCNNYQIVQNNSVRINWQVRGATNPLAHLWLNQTKLASHQGSTDLRLSHDRLFKLTYFDPETLTNSRSVTRLVRVHRTDRSAVFYANRSLVFAGDNLVTVTWQIPAGPDTQATLNGKPLTALSGTQTFAIKQNTTYSLTVRSSTGVSSHTAEVEFEPQRSFPKYFVPFVFTHGDRAWQSKALAVIAAVSLPQTTSSFTPIPESNLRKLSKLNLLSTGDIKLKTYPQQSSSKTSLPNFTLRKTNELN